MEIPVLIAIIGQGLPICAKTKSSIVKTHKIDKITPKGILQQNYVPQTKYAKLLNMYSKVLFVFTNHKYVQLQVMEPSIMRIARKQQNVPTSQRLAVERSVAKTL